MEPGHGRGRNALFDNFHRQSVSLKQLMMHGKAAVSSLGHTEFDEGGFAEF